MFTFLFQNNAFYKYLEIKWDPNVKHASGLSKLNRTSTGTLVETIRQMQRNFRQNFPGHQFFPHFFAQNNQFNRKTSFDVNKVGYNDSSGREKLLQTYEFLDRH